MGYLKFICVNELACRKLVTHCVEYIMAVLCNLLLIMEDYFFVLSYFLYDIQFLFNLFGTAHPF